MLLARIVNGIRLKMPVREGDREGVVWFTRRLFLPVCRKFWEIGDFRDVKRVAILD